MDAKGLGKRKMQLMKEAIQRFAASVVAALASL